MGGGGGLVLSAGWEIYAIVCHHHQPGAERDGGRVASEEPGTEIPGAERGAEGVTATAPEQWLGHHRQPGVERDGGRQARRMVLEEPGVNNPGAERGVEGAAA